ncbi:WD40/YVTN/BNR-like repeat-containing protein [Wocania ichthyoenteri]|uniref:WD40/YVTN/BNR-like repeat-containing protein n=1 Tax=Wocania ichthyoenteri TaxID=1230531 RepID=UPI00053E7D69|nr:oxidoreductase [Wocania ichthyoenteri]
MKTFFANFCVLLFLFSCGEKRKFKLRNFSKVEIETIFEDSLLSIRAIDILDDKSLAFAANNGVFGLYNPKNELWQTSIQHKDSFNLHFRSVAHTKEDFFMLSIENPAFLFKTGHDGKMELVYEEAAKGVFYDAMTFWNDNEGIAIGDLVGGCLSIIITRDGGTTWTKLFCDDLPKGAENEGAFAASDTNIAIVGYNTWVATTAGRVYYSPDKGNTWEVFDTPIVKEKETEGMYSIDFYDALNGFAIGGDYTKPEGNAANKIRTNDGGKTWELVAQNQNPGYRSCVQYIPNRAGKELIAIGFKGIDYSNDSGDTWKRLSDEGFYTIRFLNDSVAYAAGAGRISKLTFRE